MGYSIFGITHTSNQSKLFVYLFEECETSYDDEPAWGIYKLNGLSGKEACREIGHALARARKLGSKLQEYDTPPDPKTGKPWGTGASAVAWLGQIACICGEHRKSKIIVG